jgi:hypothetical protein
MLRPFRSAAALVAVCLPLVVSAQQVPCKPTVVGRLDIVPVTSRIFHNTRNLRVWLPPGYDPCLREKRRPMAIRRVSTDSRIDSLTKNHEPSVPTLGPFLADAEHPIPPFPRSPLHQS